MVQRSVLLLFWCASLAMAITGCQGCTTGGDNQPPTVVVSGAPSEAFVVGETLHLQIEASDPEGGGVSFDWDYKPKEADWTVDEAKFLTFTNSAVFEWAPLASDAVNPDPIQLIFIVTDDAGKVTEKTVTVDLVPGNGQPRFQSNASELYDPRTGKALEFEVKVVDQDSDQVEIEMDPNASPAGAEFERNGPYTGTFTWTPTVDQLERRVHNAKFIASDGDNPDVEFQVTIVIRSASAISIDDDQTDQMCPGEAVISHTPLGPQRDASTPYRFEATLEDDRFDRMVVYLATTDAYNGDFDPSDEEKSAESVDFVQEGDVWVAEVEPYTSLLNLSDSDTIDLYYQICAFDEEGNGADAIRCVPSSGDLELWHTFPVYAPDAPDCVEDGFDQLTGNDDIDSATLIDENWVNYRVCDGNEDYYSIRLQEGEKALIAAVYSEGADGGDVTFEAFDDADESIPLAKSDCTGLVTAEVEAAEGEGTRTFYLKATGTNTNYVVKAFKSGSAAECADAAMEPNDDASTATPVLSGDRLSAEICSGGDLDVYSIDLEAGETITVTNSFSNADGNLDMTLFGPSQAGDISTGGLGVGAYTGGFEDEESFTHTVEDSGTHYVLVFNNNDGANTYEIDFSVEDAPDCLDEDMYSSMADNHSEGTSALIPSDAELTLSDMAVCAGKPDWYRRTEFDGMLVLGELSVTGGDGTIDDVTVQVFDEIAGEPGDVVAAGTLSNGALGFDFTPSAMGVHYYKVETTARVEYELVLLR
jgi:hypothetical protein